MALFKPYKILSSALNSLPINEGQIIVTTDDQSLYIDAANNQRIKIGTTDLASKQETLISGTNIKTINNESILGSGNIAISDGTATNVQVNGTSIVNDNVANIITNTAYNASSNKIATMLDVENSVDLSSYSVGDTISDSTIVIKLKKNNVVVTNNTSKYRLVDNSNGTYLYTVMNQLDGGDYIILTESGDNLVVSQKDSTYWQLRIDANDKLSADLVDDTNTTHKFVTANDKIT